VIIIFAYKIGMHIIHLINLVFFLICRELTNLYRTLLLYVLFVFVLLCLQISSKLE
jgi:hypothetical protein